MHNLFNTKTNEQINIPSDIDELNPVQYLKYIKLIHLAETTPMPIKELRLHIFELVCPISFGFRFGKMPKNDKEEMWVQIYQLSEKMDSFFDIEEMEDRKVYRAHLKSGSNLLPEWNGFRGAEDMLNNITWGEFVSCMNFMNAYKEAIEADEQTEADAILTEFFFTLYKSKKKRKKIVVPLYIKLHALTFFSCVFELISTVPIPIHGSEIDFRIIFSGSGSTGKDNKMGWSGLVYSVAESGVFGKTDEVNKESFWSVMLYLYKCTFDNQQITTKK